MKHTESFDDVPESVAQLLAQIEISEEPLVVMGIGIAASGKSTILDQLAWRVGLNVSPIKVDSIHQRLTRLRAGRSLGSMLKRELYQQVDRSLETHQIAIIDDSYLDSHERFVDIGRFRDLGAQTIGGLLVDVDPEVVLQRNRDRSVLMPLRRITEMADQLDANRPVFHDGFDWIVTATDQEVTTSRQDFSAS